jgi:hypothetical protein
VDIIVEVASLHDYYKLGNRLRSLGFREDASAEEGPICRWIVDNIKVDIMPMQGRILGFSNRYYAMAVETAVSLEIVEGLTIRIISAPCFLATKLEAFQDRGNRDFMASPDMEDVIAVLDGRPEVLDEIWDSPYEAKTWLISALSEFLEEEEFLNSLPGHLEFEFENPERVSILLERLRTIASMGLDDC